MPGSERNVIISEPKKNERCPALRASDFEHLTTYPWLGAPGVSAAACGATFPRPGAERHPGCEQFNLDRHAEAPTASPPAECDSRRILNCALETLEKQSAVTDTMRSRQRPR